MKLKIDFYYDTFRSGILEVPDEIEEFDYDKRHEIVLKYLADALNYCVRKINASNYVSTYAGMCSSSGDTDGPLLSSLFNKLFLVEFLANFHLLVVHHYFTPQTG